MFAVYFHLYIYVVLVQYSSLQIKYGLKSLLFTFAIFSGKRDTKSVLSQSNFGIPVQKLQSY